ncbi:Aldo-ket-red domain-containing protein [Mycena chlorophos]|uniref:Aldo-ket-red domain-containing protein n=1 Tax=Mycena chlorophos TaxID=658473 RepID=A0A8H6SWW7_MYCCL|nr:Aldo-ket-red domain-containing protein [Mycena chlorophos]
MALTITSSVRLSTSYLIPQLGFGVYQNPDAKRSCLEAFKAGYRHVDSAQGYKNEELVGQAVRESGLKREDVFITTKCDSHTSTHGYDTTLKAVDASLASFGFEYIDLFLVHDPLAGKDRRLGAYKALLEAKAAGKIRSVGVSNFNVHHLEEIKEAGYETPSVNQIELHPFCQQKPIAEYCRKNGIILEAYCPIIRGQMDHEVITKLATKACTVQSRSGTHPPSVVSSERVRLLNKIFKISAEESANSYVPLPKSATPSRIHSNANLYDFQLDNEEMAALDALDRGTAGSISWNPVNAP